MKLIHTADLHFGAKMESVFPPEIAKIRRKEQKEHLTRLFDFAEKEGVAAILIAGDLFDTLKPREELRSFFLKTVQEHPTVGVYYLRGNHDAGLFLDMPENLHLFSDSMTAYPLGEGVMLYGTETLSPDMYDRLLFSPDDTNILLLHGAAAESGYGGDTVNLRALQRKHIDYLALGHYHTAEVKPLDARGIYAYAGTPEGRGFDECGKKGFFLLDTAGTGITPNTAGTASEKLRVTFCSRSFRTLHEVTLSLVERETADACLDRLAALLAEISASDIVRVLLPDACPLKQELVSAYLADRFFYAEVKKVTLSVAYTAERYQEDISLRGEFVRSVLRTALSESEKEDVLLYGLSALLGEGVDEL